ncbi:MAG TPA: SAM-dependent chlorinase/fluorinase [Tepidisphaeraceae bacterium]|nr:SAM-dependent chlorinase/fluorinase [Tepidisphaeraceae bacterium]
MHRAMPIVTLTSDFGASDHYVAAMKAAVLKNCPHARLIDVTHQIPRHDILRGSIVLERAIDGFPPGTVHLAVVDPGVGTQRRIIVVKIKRQFVVCPDNGLITWAWRSRSGAKAFELTWRPKKASNTFHGRDVLGPVAGKIASDARIGSLARNNVKPILLDIAPSKTRQGQIIYFDHFGNAMTNIGEGLLGKIKFKNVLVHGKKLGKLKRTYGDVAPGVPLALIGSSGLLEIAVRDGNAAKQLKLKVGDRIRLD